MGTVKAAELVPPPPPPPFYLDEKWKLSKKEISSRSSRSSSSSNLVKPSSQKRCAFSRKCARLVKEQRARFYIMRRCVTMLICWRDYTDFDGKTQFHNDPKPGMGSAIEERPGLWISWKSMKFRLVPENDSWKQRREIPSQRFSIF